MANRKDGLPKARKDDRFELLSSQWDKPQPMPSPSVHIALYAFSDKLGLPQKSAEDIAPMHFPK